MHSKKTISLNSSQRFREEKKNNIVKQSWSTHLHKQIEIPASTTQEQKNSSAYTNRYWFFFFFFFSVASSLWHFFHTGDNAVPDWGWIKRRNDYIEKVIAFSERGFFFLVLFSISEKVGNRKDRETEKVGWKRKIFSRFDLAFDIGAAMEPWEKEISACPS